MHHKGSTMSKITLNGCLDLHIHCHPDVKERAVNDISMAQYCIDSGMRGFLIKSHDWSTHDRASIAKTLFPECEIFGSLCMNLSHGPRVNPFAVSQAVKTWGNSCRCVWLPTRESAFDMKRNYAKHPGIPVVDAYGNVLPEVIKTMEICAEADIILASGHSSNEETVALAQAAKEVGLHKFVVTHATSDPWMLSLDTLKKCFALDAYVEHAYVALIWGPGTPFPHYKPCSIERMLEYIAVCPERTFLTSDLGTAGLPAPHDGMTAFMNLLYTYGISIKSIDHMTKTLPAMLMNLKEQITWQEQTT